MTTAVDADADTTGPLSVYLDAEGNAIKPNQGATLVTLVGGALGSRQGEVQVRGTLPPALFGQMHRTGLTHDVIWYRRANRTRSLTYRYDATVTA